MRDRPGDETEHAESVHADLAVRGATQRVGAGAVGEEGEPCRLPAGSDEGGGGGVGHHGEGVDVGGVHVGGLDVAVHQQYAPTRGGGKLSCREQAVGVAAAG